MKANSSWHLLFKSCFEIRSPSSVELEPQFLIREFGSFVTNGEKNKAQKNQNDVHREHARFAIGPFQCMFFHSSVIWMFLAPSWLDSQKAAETRQSPLAEYCRSLISQPPHISRCRLVCSFFAVRPEDENPLSPSVSPSRYPSLVESFPLSRQLVCYHCCCCVNQYTS